MFAKLVERCSANSLQFTAGKHWLENRRSINCALGGTRANKRVNLVDEQNDVSASFDFFENFFEAFFKVSAIATAGDQCAKVECV